MWNNSVNFDSFNNCSNNENDEIINSIKYLLLWIPSGVLLKSLNSLILYTMIKPLKTG